MFITEDDRKMFASLTFELKRSNDLREKEIKRTVKGDKRKRRRHKDWLFADEVVDKLRPGITETQSLKILREAGKLGMPDEGYKQIGRAYFYNPKAIEQLRRQFEAGIIQPIKRK